MRKPTLFVSTTDSAPLMEINTTPLIDVLLVLLIMMIISLPLATHAVKIDLSHGPAGSKVVRERVDLEIDFDGSLYWNGEPLAGMNALEQRFVSVVAQSSQPGSKEQPDIALRANARVTYEIVAQALAAAQRLGIQHLGIVGNDRFAE